MDKKLLRKGGETTLSEIAKALDISRRRALTLVRKHYSDCTLTELPRHTKNQPKMSIKGLRLIRPEELSQDATVIIVCFAPLKTGFFDKHLKFGRELKILDYDIKRTLVGYRGNSIILLSEGNFNGICSGYGMAKTLLSISSKVEVIYKLGIASSQYDMGTIAVLAPNEDGIFLYDNYNNTVANIGSCKNIPCGKAMAFSLEAERTKRFKVIRTSVTSGPLLNSPQSYKVEDIYECEFAGIFKATEYSDYVGKVGLVSAIVDNYDQGDGRSHRKAIQSCRRLANFMMTFLDSGYF